MVIKRLALVVEDDPNVQQAMSERLERLGFEVLLALHYEGAIEHLKAAEPTFVCVALALPTVSGYDLCEYIRGPRGLESVPILVTSESTDPNDLANAEQAGANALLEKPFSMHDFERHVAALITETDEQDSNIRRLRS